MLFDGTEGGLITLERAATLTAEFRKRNVSNPCQIRAHYFGRNHIANLINQEGCVGTRIYHGVDPDTGAKEVVLVGVDQNGNDMLGMILDLSKPCPNTCSCANPLNNR